MKLKIVSDGTFEGTKVVNTETDEIVENVVGLSFKADPTSFDTIHSTLHIVNLSLDLQIEPDKIIMHKFPGITCIGACVDTEECEQCVEGNK